MRKDRQAYRAIAGMGLVSQAMQDAGIGHMPTKAEWKRIERAQDAGMACPAVVHEITEARRRALQEVK